MNKYLNRRKAYLEKKLEKVRSRNRIKLHSYHLKLVAKELNTLKKLNKIEDKIADKLKNQ